MNKKLDLKIKKDLCVKCEHYWEDFPLPLDSVKSHCEIIDKKYGIDSDMEKQVPYPCEKCPFNSYEEKITKL